MAFTTKSDFAFKHADLGDTPTFASTAILKADLDSQAGELRTWINNFLTELAAQAAAANIGASIGGSASNIQAFIAMVEAAGTGTLPPANTVTDVMLSNIAGQIKSVVAAHIIDYTQNIPYGGTTTGSANTYVLTSPSISALTAGMAVSFKINVDSTSTSTLNWDSKGAKTIKKANGTAVTNLKNGGIYTARYDGTDFILQGDMSSGDATASDIILGKTCTTDAGEITGTLACDGTAAEGNVVVGKTFYSTDPKTKLTGTGASAKKYASGAGIMSSNTMTITGIDFRPKLIVVDYHDVALAHDLRTVYNGYHGVADCNALYYLDDQTAFSGVSWVINDDGFVLTLNLADGKTPSWYAFE